MIAGGGLLLSTWAQDGILRSLSEAISALTASALHACGVAVERYDRVLSAARGGFSMRVDNECNGAWAHLIFFASILAYPATWREKLLGLAIGEPLLFFLNVFRVASLFLAGIYVPALFRAMHVYVWQFLIIGLALVLLFVWVDRFVEKPE
jgi:exosortase H (IPTLxxWG-CTERM-specific)